MHGAVSYEIAAAHLLERLAQQGPIFRIVVTQKCLVKSPLAQAFNGPNLVAVTLQALQGVEPRVIHGGRRGHRRRVKSLYLIGAEPVLLEPER